MEICDICFGYIQPSDLVRIEGYVAHRCCVQRCQKQVQSFGAPIFKETPNGFMWGEDSCFIDSLVYLYLTADSDVFRRIITERPSSFDYSSVKRFKCEERSKFANKNNTYVVEHFREMAVGIQNQLKQYIEEMRKGSTTTHCRLLRENVALCVRSVFGDLSYEAVFGDVANLTRELVLPAMVPSMPALTYEQAARYGREIHRGIAELSKSGKYLKTQDEFFEFIRKLIYTANIEHSMAANPAAVRELAKKFSSAIASADLSKILHGVQGDPTLIHEFFSTIFPIGLQMRYIKKGAPNTVIRSSDIPVEDYTDRHDPNAVNLVSLAENELITFSNQTSRPQLGKSGVFSESFAKELTYEVNRPLELMLEIAGASYELVGVVRHEGYSIESMNHFTCFTKFNGRWYSYDDLKEGKDRTSRIDERKAHFFATEKTGGGLKVPVLFFYARTSV